jgi:methyl-accepting chemotaxis protein
MKIGKKLVIIIIALNLLGTSALVGTILRIAYREISSLTASEITNLAGGSAKDIQIWLELYLDAARTVSQIMEGYEQIEVNQRRPFLTMMVKSLVEKNPEVVGASSCWEPNALDGLDALYINTAESDGTGRFIPYAFRDSGGIGVEGLVDYETPGDGDWYLDPRRTGNENLSEPYHFSVNGEDVLMTTVSTPIKHNGNFAGVVTADLALTVIQQTVDKIKPYEGSVAAVFSNAGMVCAHFDTARIGKSMTETEQDVAGPHLQNLMDAIQNGSVYTFTNYVSSLKEDMYFVCTPFSAGKTGTSWALMIGIPQHILTLATFRMLIIGLAIAAVMLAVMALASFLIARSISRPLGRMVTMLHDVGNGDLTQRLDLHSKDEIGEMASSFNVTLDNIRGLILIIKQKIVSLSEIGTELSTNMTETAAAINEITSNIQSMKGQAAKQSGGVAEEAAAMGKITASINQLNGQIDKQTESVTQSSSAIEEMLANIQSVTQTLVNNEGNVRDLSGASDAGRTGLQEVAANIQEISKESEGLLEINSVMQNIASQTNLLSMNAAIEAAHAGEAGKGFAVVADEIRKLAESSGEQSKTISAVLKKIKESIDKITVSTDAVLKKFEAIDSGVRIVSDQEENIRNAMEEQGQGSKQILEAVSRLNEITGQVKEGSMEMHSNSLEVIETSKNVESITQEITNGMSEMATGADQINIAINRVNEISGTNKNDIDELIREVDKFTIEE